MKTSEEILDLIQKSGISIIKIAEDTKVSQANIYKWLQKKHKPDYEKLLIIENYLNNLSKTPKLESIELNKNAPADNRGVDKDELLASLIRQNEKLINSNSDLITNTLVLTSQLQASSNDGQQLPLAVLQRLKALEIFVLQQINQGFPIKERKDLQGELGKIQTDMRYSAHEQHHT